MQKNENYCFYNINLDAYKKKAIVIDFGGGLNFEERKRLLLLAEEEYQENKKREQEVERLEKAAVPSLCSIHVESALSEISSAFLQMLGDEKAGTDEHDSRFDEIIIALKRELFAGGKQSILVSLSWLQVSEIDSDIDSKIDSELNIRE